MNDSIVSIKTIVLENRESVNLFPQKLNDSDTSVVFFNPVNHTYLEYTSYNYRNILSKIKTYSSDSFFVVLINNDIDLYRRISKLALNPAFASMIKMFDVSTDFIFTPIEEMLIFNVCMIKQIEHDNIEKDQLKVILYKNGLFLFASCLQTTLMDIFEQKLDFEKMTNDMEFFEKAFHQRNALELKLERLNISNLSHIKGLRSHSIKFEKRKSNRIRKSLLKTFLNSLRVNDEELTENPNKAPFDIDMLIFYILEISNDKMQEAVNKLQNEAESIRSIYLNVSPKERKDFFNRVQSLEMTLKLMEKETFMKLSFQKKAKSKFERMKVLSNNRFFKSEFMFLLEVMSAQNEYVLASIQQIKKIIRMVRYNFSFMVKDSEEKEEHELNKILKILAIISFIYLPVSVMATLFGVNITVPYETETEESLTPFFLIITTMFAVSVGSMIILFKFNLL